MSIAEKLTTIAENEPKVYDAGKKAQYDEFWNSLQANGAFKSYQYAFGGGLWSATTFKPKYPLNATNLLRCFAESGIKTIEQTINAERCTSSTSLQNTFYNADIVTIAKMIVSASTIFDSTTFRGCTALRNFNIVGTIGKNGFDLTYATYITRDSLLSILNACNKQAASVTIALPSKCIDNSTTTKTYIENDTELNTALYSATTNGYTVVYG